MARRALAILLVALGSACTGPEIGKPPDWPVSRPDAHACMQRPETRAFLQSARERVLAKWRLPNHVAADHRVVLGFVLDEQGRPGRVAVFEASNRELARSVLRAFDESAPFLIPPGAECVAGIPIVGTFTNPADHS